MEVKCRYEVLRNIPRDWAPWCRWLSWHQRYLWEQRTFWWSLRRRLGRRDLDVLHVTDPLLSELARRWGPSNGVSVVYKDGLQLGPEWCSRFDWVQVLAPYYRDVAERRGMDVSRWSVIPHLVNTDVFAPAPDRADARRRCPGGPLPEKGPLVIAAGDLSPSSNKRLNVVVEELARVRGPLAPSLLLAGQAGESELRAFESWARGLLGARLHLRPNVSPLDMPSIYRCGEVFVHAAKREPFGIVFLEAMASGLPILAHHFDVTAWIIGDAGVALDTEKPGTISGELSGWLADGDRLRGLSERARARAVQVFDRRRIVPMYLELESRMRAASGGGGP